MAGETTYSDDVVVSGFPRLEVPLGGIPSAEELERRKRRIARARELRKEIGSIDISTDDLLHLGREDAAK